MVAAAGVTAKECADKSERCAELPHGDSVQAELSERVKDRLPEKESGNPSYNRAAACSDDDAKEHQRTHQSNDRESGH